MAFNDDAKNLMLDALGAAVTYFSLHSAHPASGGNELAGGSPAYARKGVTWSSAASGSMSASNQPVFDVPAATVAAVGFWSAVTSGTLYGDDDVTDEVFAAQGTYTITSATFSLT